MPSPSSAGTGVQEHEAGPDCPHRNAGTVQQLYMQQQCTVQNSRCGWTRYRKRVIASHAFVKLKYILRGNVGSLQALLQTQPITLQWSLICSIIFLVRILIFYTQYTFSDCVLSNSLPVFFFFFSLLHFVSFSILLLLLVWLQKILCEDRFVAVEAEALESQLLSQMLDAVRVTPMLHEDLQVEVMKVSPLCTLDYKSDQMT